MNIKEIKSIDLSSFTVITTGIAVLFAVVSSLLITILAGITSPASLGIMIYLIPTIIVGTLMYNIYNCFFEGYLYNTLAKRINTVKFVLNDGEILKITTTETAVMIAIIMTVQIILLYLVSVLLLPLLLNAFVQTLILSGQSNLGYALYQFLMILSQPTTVILIIFGTFIISFVFILIGTYIYNFIAKSGRGAVVNLSKENDFTVVESVDVLKLAIAFAIVGGVLNLIVAVLSLLSGGTFAAVIGNIIGGFISSFITGALIAVFYNFLAPKLGKLKLELIDF